MVGCVLFTLCATMASTEVGWEDSAFLQLCHATLGVPHGPGFPLYVVLGRVWVWPFGDASAHEIGNAPHIDYSGSVLYQECEMKRDAGLA